MTKTPSSKCPVDPYARCTHQAVSPRTSMRASPTRVADLPRRPAAVLLDVEVGRHPEVALAAGGELDLAADPRHAEGADVLAVEVAADHVPDAVVREQGVGVERPLGDLVAGDRPVLEPDRALLRDRALELGEPARHLGRVVGIEHLDAAGGLRRRLVEAGAAQREVLQREPQRLGVGELPLEQVEGGLERRQLVVRRAPAAAGSTARSAGCRAPRR